MKRIFFLMLLGVIASSGFAALEPILIGDFESGLSGGRYDDWFSDSLTIVDETSIGVTHLTHSLKITSEDGGWGWGIQNNSLYKESATGTLWTDALTAPGVVIAVDITAVSSDITGEFLNVAMLYNVDSPDGWGTSDFYPVEIDGISHTYYIEVPEAAQTAIQNAVDKSGWGANIGIVFETEAGDSTVYLDNIWIYPDGPISEYAAYGPSIEQEFNTDPMFVDLTFHWNAGNDPNDDTYPIHPDIVDQYVFLKGVDVGDPNFYYIGSTGEDPGLVDPASQFGPVTIPSNSKYEWIVVEAMSGHAQTFTVNVSVLEDVSEDNIRSTKWEFNTLGLVPVIETQPVSVRYPVGGPGPSLTIAVSSVSTPHYQWYYSPNNSEVDEADIAINSSIGGNTDTMTIPAANKAYQAYYYCRVSNAATVSEGGGDPDVYSDVVGCVVERKIAEYLFEGNLANSTGEGSDGEAVNGAATVSGDSVEGSSALVLNGVDQYVRLVGFTDSGEDGQEGTEDDIYHPGGYPNSGLADVGGIGGGMDVGSVTCWVKVNSTSSTRASILANTNLGWPVTQFQFAIDTDASATFTDLHSEVWGNQDNGAVFWQSGRPDFVENFNISGDGEWHMLAVTWDMTGEIHAYIDANLVSIGTCTSNEFGTWTNDTLIGAFQGDSISNYFDGKIDNLCVYNYQLTPGAIGQDYFDVTGKVGCISGFSGQVFDVVHLGSSYCRVDIEDFAAFAAGWLSDGFFEAGN